MPETRLFISHSSQDVAWCRPFVAALRTAGYMCFYDEDSIPSMTAWVRMIEQGVRDCDIFLFVLSPIAWESRWVGEEVQLALVMNKSILVVVHEPTQIEGLLLTRQWIQAVGLTPEDAASQVIRNLPALSIDQTPILPPLIDAQGSSSTANQKYVSHHLPAWLEVENSDNLPESISLVEDHVPEMPSLKSVDTQKSTIENAPNSSDTSKTPSRPLLDRLRDMLPAQTTPAVATGTIVIPRHMYPKHKYNILVRLQCRITRKLSDQPNNSPVLAMIEVEASLDAFYLPVKKMALPIPLNGGLSEASLSVTAQRASPNGTDRMTFSFRLADGTSLHKGRLFVAEIMILTPQQIANGNPMVTLVQPLDIAL